MKITKELPGNRIKRLRKLRGLSIKEYAKIFSMPIHMKTPKFQF